MRPRPPKLLYKYQTVESFSKTITCGVFNDTGMMFRFTQPCYLNDPYEARIIVPELAPVEKILCDIESSGIYKKPSNADEGFSVIKDYCKKNNLSDASASDFLSQLELSALEANARKGSTVFSLTEHCNSLPLWAYYADDGKGVCVGFNTLDTFFNQPITNNEIAEVYRYHGKLGQTFLCDAVGTVERVDYLGALKLAKVIKDRFLLVKSNDWAHESEWRLIKPVFQCNSMVDVEGQTIFLFNVPYSAIDSLCLGYNFDFSTQEAAAIYKFLTEKKSAAHLLNNTFKVSREVGGRFSRQKLDRLEFAELTGLP